MNACSIMGFAKEKDEKEIVLRASQGHRDSFALLYNQYVTGLYQYVFLFTKSKEDTEELIQEIFVKIWEQKQRLAEVQSFKSYLYTSVKNRVIDKVRNAQVRRRVLSEIQRTTAVEAHTTEQQLDYKAYYLLVQQAIEKLPPKRKLIFRLNVENGLSKDEIAAQLHISQSVVQKQLYKAIHFVKRYLFENSGASFQP